VIIACGRAELATAIVLIIAALNCGCYGWRPEPVVPTTPARDVRVSTFRVWLTDSSNVVLHDARHLHSGNTVALALIFGAGIGATIFLSTLDWSLEEL
jgi:hypothetical protein